MPTTYTTAIITPQHTGTFFTTPLDGTVNDLVIKKDQKDQTVIQDINLTVQGVFKETRGSLEKNGRSLKLMHMSGKKSDPKGGIFSEKSDDKKI